MSIYPPPPPGWDSRRPPAAQAPDPEAERRSLAVWAHARGYELNEKPDLAWYAAWAPFIYLFKPARLGREIRAQLSDASIWLVEAYDQPAPSETEGNDCYLLSFLTSPRLAYRAALRSRMQKEAVDELRAAFNPRKSPRSLSRWRWRERENFLRRTYGRGVRGVLGDAIFEAHCEIATPSREEGLAALPVALRHLLVQGGWRGILEFRPGGLVGTTYGPPLFDPASLDATFGLVVQIYNAATRITHGAPPPSSNPASSGPYSPR
jgi:hypothetical protein